MAPIPDPTKQPNEQTELIVVSCTLWGECRGSHDDERMGIANVILNRVLAGIFPGGTDWSKVCLAPLQFSCWNSNNINRTKMLEPLSYGSKEEWDSSYATALMILGGTSGPDTTNRSTHYHAFPDIHDPRVMWANNPRYKYEVTIGKTHFFRDLRAFQPATDIATTSLEDSS